MPDAATADSLADLLLAARALADEHPRLLAAQSVVQMIAEGRVDWDSTVGTVVFRSVGYVPDGDDKLAINPDWLDKSGAAAVADAALHAVNRQRILR